MTLDDEPRSPGRGQLTFVQEVVRDVAYSTVSRRDRRTIHLAAADHLEALHDEELVEAVAEHLLAASRAAPSHPDAPVLARRAVGALRLAAARALTLRVPGQALTHLERALELVDDDPTRAVLWHEAAVAGRAAARFDLAESLLRQLIDWQTANGERSAAARTRAQLASLLLATERHGSALGDLEAALAEVGDLAADASSVELGGQLARAHVLVGHDQLALEWANRTLEAAAVLGLPAAGVDALITRGTAQMRLGNESAGLADLHAAIADAQRSDLIGAELRARNNLAWLVAPDDPHATMATARGGLELATRMGVGDMALQLAEVVCAVAIDTGDWDAALTVIDEVRDRPQAPAHRILFAASEATLRALRGDASAGAILDGARAGRAGHGPPDRREHRPGQGVDRVHRGSARGCPLAGPSGRRPGRSAPNGTPRRSSRPGSRCGSAIGPDVAAQIAQLDRMGAHGQAAEAAEATLRAGAAALADEASAAATYEDAVAAWRSLRLPLHLALCLAERQRFVPAAAGPGRDPGGEAEAILVGLGAAGVLDAVRAVRRGRRSGPTGRLTRCGPRRRRPAALDARSRSRVQSGSNRIAGCERDEYPSWRRQRDPVAGGNRGDGGGEWTREPPDRTWSGNGHDASRLRRRAPAIQGSADRRRGRPSVRKCGIAE